MAIVYDTLAQGQVPASATVLYTAPASGAIISYVQFMNVHATDSVTIKVWRNGQTDSKIWRQTVTLAPGESIEADGPFTMGNADTIDAIAGAASKVNYIIDGATP